MVEKIIKGLNKKIDGTNATKLDKVSVNTIEEQAYIKLPNGQQAMQDVSVEPLEDSIVKRTETGEIKASDAVEENEVVTKRQMDESLIGAVTETELTTNPQFLPNTGDGFINEIELYGKSIQNSTPTPEEPRAILNVPSELDITSCGVNLANPNNALKRLESDTITVDGNRLILNRTGFGSASYFGIKVKVKPNTTYRVNRVVGASVLANIITVATEPTSALPTPYLRIRPFAANGTITTNDDEHWIILCGIVEAVAASGNYYIENIMLNPDSSDFIPYIGTTTTPFQIKDNRGLGADSLHELCSLPLPSGESDKIVDGKIIKELFEYVVDHTVATGKVINVVDVLSNDTYTYFYKSDTAIFGTYPNGLLKDSAIPLCDKFTFLPSMYAQQEGVYISNANPPSIQFNILNSRAGILAGDNTTTKQTKIIAWLQSNPLTVQLAWATPKIYDLHPDENQKLKTLPTYQGGTNLWTTTNNGTEPDIWTKEFHDSEIGKDVLLKNKNGETLNPITNAGAVLFKDGYDLAEKIAQLQAQLADFERWEDITGLFTPTTADRSYKLSKNNLSELIENIPIRITLELSSISSNVVSITGTIQLYATVTMAGTYKLLTNTIYSSDTISYKGNLEILNNDISYFYEVDITDEPKRPKILKVERLVE